MPGVAFRCSALGGLWFLLGCASVPAVEQEPDVPPVRDPRVASTGAGRDATRESKPRRPSPPSSDTSEWNEELQRLAAQYQASPGGTAPRLDVLSHPRTEHYIRHFTRSKGGRATFQAWLRRLPKYRAMIEQRLLSSGVSPELLAVAMIESGLQPGAVSSAGATGMWQFMEETARRYGLETELGRDQRRDPELATAAAAVHLRDLYQSFHDWPLALAAYNAGEQRIRTLMQSLGASSFWQLQQESVDLPRETANYVPKVLAAVSILRDLPRFGFKVSDQAEIEESFLAEISGGLTLRGLASVLLARQEDIRSLNPWLDDGALSSLDEPLEVRLPDSSKPLAELLVVGPVADPRVHRTLLRRASSLGRRANAQYWWRLGDVNVSGAQPGGWEELLQVAQGTNQRTYRMRPGDSLGRLARMFGVDEEQLRRQNNVTNPRAIPVGALLTLPLEAGATSRL